jgi:hypothetical protein
LNLDGLCKSFVVLCVEMFLRADFGVPFFCGHVCVLKWWICGVVLIGLICRKI